jgi:hypothetical protein
MSGIIIIVYLPDARFINLRNNICQQLIFGLFSSLFLIRYSNNKSKIILLIYISLFFYLSLLLGSRSVFISGFLSIFVFIMLTKKPSFPAIFNRFILSLGFTGLFIFSFYEKIVSLPTVYRLLGFFGLDYYMSPMSKVMLLNIRGQDRFYIYEDTWNLFLRKPWTGYGFGVFDSYSNYVYTHSVYLELLFAGGIITLFFFIIFLFSIIYHHTRVYLRPNGFDGRYSAFVLSILAALIVYGIFYPIFYSQVFWFFLLLGAPQFAYLGVDSRKAFLSYTVSLQH